jgi:hypothetical protein
MDYRYNYYLQDAWETSYESLNYREKNQMNLKPLRQPHQKGPKSHMHFDSKTWNNKT